MTFDQRAPATPSEDVAPDPGATFAAGIRAGGYQAFAFVRTPDYSYWNPVPGTRAGCRAECRALAEAYARRTFVAPRYPAWRAERFLRELEVRPASRGARPSG